MQLKSLLPICVIVRNFTLTPSLKFNAIGARNISVLIHYWISADNENTALPCTHSVLIPA